MGKIIADLTEELIANGSNWTLALIDKSKAKSEKKRLLKKLAARIADQIDAESRMAFLADRRNDIPKEIEAEVSRLLAILGPSGGEVVAIRDFWIEETRVKSGDTAIVSAETAEKLIRSGSATLPD